MSSNRFESTLVHNNMFGFRGVDWDATRGKFRARIFPDNHERSRWLGRYDTAIEAAKAYDEAARDVYGTDAYLNFPTDDEKQTVPSKRAEGRCPKGHDLSVYGYKHGHITNCRKCNAASQRRYKSRH